jgi:outer membrane protein assembly factor BamD (BamD/ComL family)
MKLKVIKFTIFIAAVIFPLNIAAASEDEIIRLTRSYYDHKEYYNSITEAMRYQYNYPDGKYYPESMLIMGKSYFLGDNYYKATEIFTLCYEKFKSSAEGEESLLHLGSLRLMKGAPYYACRTFQEYQYIYNDGRFKEDAAINLTRSLALMEDYNGALKSIDDYDKNYPDGKYRDNIISLKALINGEINRPKKNVWVSVIGSVFVPGFGHFYAGQFSTGLISLLSNAVLISLFCDAYRDKDAFRMLVFGMGEMAFYQYSLYSAISNVYHYNSTENYKKEVKLGIIARF